MIININGNPYTTATEDLRIQELKKNFRCVLAAELDSAMKTARDGTLRLDMRGLEDFLQQAYYMGREDGQK